jgi:cell division protein ZipA
MDLTIRDWMVIIGVLLIVAVGLDAWRRVRKERYPRVKMKLAEESSGDADVEIAWLKELPNGGARVVERGDLLKAAQAAADTGHAGTAPEEIAPAAERSAAARARRAAAEAPAPAPAPQAPADEVELVSGMSSADDSAEPATLDWLDGIVAEEAAAPKNKPVPPPAGTLPRGVDPEVFMLNVVARSREGFRGEDILHILLACDLRFGDMSFFHRHEFEAGRGAIQFSVANMMQPGVFDIDNMADFNTPGLVFFLTLPGPEDMMKAFDYMLETAQAVARNLDGDVLDESRSVLTKQTLEHCRQQIRDLERRMLAKAR